MGICVVDIGNGRLFHIIRSPRTLPSRRPEFEMIEIAFGQKQPPLRDRVPELIRMR